MSWSFEIASTWDGVPVDAERVSVDVHLHGDDLALDVDAPFHGDPPPAAPPGPCWGLWEHEVVELFVVGPDGRYVEIELGPHGHHLVLRLAGVRQIVEREIAIAYAVSIGGGRWRARAVVPGRVLPPVPWRANVYAIHGSADARRYLAWAPLPGAKPDFHQPDRFPAIPGPVR